MVIVILFSLNVDSNEIGFNFFNSFSVNQLHVLVAYLGILYNVFVFSFSVIAPL